jgi:hypothetical protein
MYLLNKGHRTKEVDNAKLRDKALKDGWNVIDKKGKILTPATGGRDYTAVEYNAVVAERDKAIQALADLKAK